MMPCSSLYGNQPYTTSLSHHHIRGLRLLALAGFAGHELGPGELGEAAAFGDELVEGAGLDDAALVEAEDAVGVADGREPVRDDEGGAPLHDLLERELELALGRGVERARRLVEDQHRRVLEQRAGDREALALAAGERAPALADRGIEAVGLAVDEFERLGALERLDHLLVGGIRAADLEVLADRAREQHRLLEHDADVAAERCQADVADVVAV